MKNWAVFLISGRDLNTNDISKMLGIKPDRVNFNEIEGITSWQLNSSLEGYKSLEEHIEDILKKLYKHRKELSYLSKRFKLQMILNIDKEIMHISLSCKYLVILGSIGIDLEIYI